MSFSKKIIDWYVLNKRSLPWRDSSDPYLIWISEIILQQTRVEQGLPYYYKFSKKFPNVHKLASAKEIDVLKLWQGLGYYSRARNMLLAAKQVVNEFDGKFPNSLEELLTLKGVGEYTAAAISSFAFNKPNPVIDGNVFRLLSRVFGVYTPINTSEGKQEFLAIARKLIDQKNPAVYNQAIMEFGSLVCKPLNPNCSNCPLSSECLAFKKQIQSELPVKLKKKKQKNRYFNYFVIQHKDVFLFQKRMKKDIWQNLYEFPLIETNSFQTVSKISNNLEWKSLFSKYKVNLQGRPKIMRHVLSHQIIHARFFELMVNRKIVHADYKIVHRPEIKHLPVSRLIEKYLNEILKVSEK